MGQAGRRKVKSQKITTRPDERCEEPRGFHRPRPADRLSARLTNSAPVGSTLPSVNVTACASLCALRSPLRSFRQKFPFIRTSPLRDTFTDFHALLSAATPFSLLGPGSSASVRPALCRYSAAGIGSLSYDYSTTAVAREGLLGARRASPHPGMGRRGRLVRVSSAATSPPRLPKPPVLGERTQPLTQAPKQSTGTV